MALRILVVDDNRDTLKLYIKSLHKSVIFSNLPHGDNERDRMRSIVIEEADTIPLAIEKLNSLSVDILVVDLKIPGLNGNDMGGLDLITESVNSDPLRPIIVITGYGNIELVKRAYSQGIYDFIEKSSTSITDLVKAVQGAIDARIERIIRSGNPFTTMTGIEPAVFGGRIKELEFFEERINRALYTRYREHFLVLGDWGLGKSTLLREFKKISNSRGYIAAIVPLEPLLVGTKLIEAAQSIIAGTVRGLPFTAEKFNSLNEYYDKIGITIIGNGLELSRDTSRKTISAQTFLHDTLIRLWDDLKDKTDMLVIMLDDLDNIVNVPEIVMTLKQTLSMESMGKCRILFGLSSTPATWHKIIKDGAGHNPLARYFISRIELELFKEKELYETISRTLKATGVTFHKDIVARVYEYSTGHPFEMQVLCYHLFNNQLSQRVDAEVWDKALQAALRDMGNATFNDWIQQTSWEEHKILNVIAKSEEPLTSQGIQRKVGEEEVVVYLQRLVDNKLINKYGKGYYSIPDKMFQRYVLIRSQMDSSFQ